MSQNTEDANQNNDADLATALKSKSRYLNQLQMALSNHNDLLVYKLLNTKKYYQIIKQKRYDTDYDYQALIKDLIPQLSHHLSHNLIKYLKRTYPFFYYYEDHLGNYQVFFGDWWGHKLFGTLDVINVKFDFKRAEYDKLRQAFDHQHQNIDVQSIKLITNQNKRLSKLIKTQTKRDNEESELKSDLKANESQARMPWNSSRIKENYSLISNKLKKLTRQDQKANNAKSQITSNQHKMLEYSKENTVIGYEKQCIKKYFSDLGQFNENNKQLYYNYISSLLAGGKD